MTFSTLALMKVYFYKFFFIFIYSLSNYLFLKVKTQCWNTTEILAWMQQQGLSDFNQVFNFYEQQLYGMAEKYGKTPVNWQEVFDMNVQLPSNVVVQVWEEYVINFIY